MWLQTGVQIQKADFLFQGDFFACAGQTENWFLLFSSCVCEWIPTFRSRFSCCHKHGGGSSRAPRLLSTTVRTTPTTAGASARCSWILEEEEEIAPGAMKSYHSLSLQMGREKSPPHIHQGLSKTYLSLSSSSSFARRPHQREKLEVGHVMTIFSGESNDEKNGFGVGGEK